MSSTDPCPICASRRWTNNHDGNDRCAVCGHLRPRTALVTTAGGIDEEGEYIASVGRRTVRRDATSDGMAGASSSGRSRRRQRFFEGVERRRFHVLVQQAMVRRMAWAVGVGVGGERQCGVERVVRGLWELRVQRLVGSGVLDESVRVEFSSRGPGSDEDEDEDEDDEDDEEDVIKYRPLDLEQAMPKLDEAVALCYLAVTYVLRQPVFVGDFIRWIEDRRIPYINAFEELPRAMQERMDLHGLNRARRKETIHPDRLQARIYCAIQGYQKTFNLKIHPLNVPPLLLRLVIETSMPIEVYKATKAIAKILNVTFSYPTKTDRSGFRRLPDTLLAACFIIAVTVLYPFDDRPRLPNSKSEPGIAIVDWEKWAEERSQLLEKLKDKNKPLTHDEGMKTTELDALYMDDNDMDRYMDWFEETFVMTRSTSKATIDPSKHAFTGEMYKLFPLKPSTSKPTTSKAAIPDERDEEISQIYLDALKQTQINLKFRQPSDESNILRPGESSVFYRDIVPEGPPRMLYTAVANLVGMSIEVLRNSVSMLEFQLRDWAVNKKQQKYGLRKHPRNTQSKKQVAL